MKPMLAKNFEPRYLNKYNGIFIQPKLDGVRAIWTSKQLLTRSGKEILGCPQLISYLSEKFPSTSFDGELYSHTENFDNIVGNVKRTKKIEENLNIEYHVYDIPTIGTNIKFTDRLARLKELILEKDAGRIRLVETRQIEPDLSLTTKDLVKDLNIYAEHGYEGTMVRNGDGIYVSKRSSDLLKIKSWEDDEFELVGCEQLTTKEKIMLSEWEPGALQYSDGSYYRNGIETPVEAVGRLVLRTKDGTEFGVGTGLTDEQRKSLWLDLPIGQMIQIKYQELTKDGIPRFPVFLRIRDDNDY